MDEYERRKLAETYGGYIAKANLPQRQAATKTDLEPRWAKAYTIASSLIANGNGVIVALIGTRGTGKTQLAVEIVKDETMKFCSQDRWRPERFALYSTAARLFMAQMRFYDRKPNSDAADPFEAFLAPRLLVLDEIQVRTGRDWEQNMLTTLLDERYFSNKSTVVIGNSKPENFASVIGDSASDRVNEGGGMIVMDWESRRGAL